MKAIFYSHYGALDSLYLSETDKPIPKNNEVLIKIAAVSINEWDWAMLQGVPFANRLMSGLRKPGIRVLGADIAGTIEAVGKDVHRFKTGDEVFGDLSKAPNKDEMKYCGGGLAEYVCTTEHGLLLKPNSLTFVQSASLPQAGALAIQGLRLGYPFKPGQQVLINGASGGVGTIALQVCKSFATNVTAVCRGSKSDFVSAIGADEVIDYQKIDFTKLGRHFDFILDVKGYHSLLECRRALKSGGRYVMLGGATSKTIQMLLLGRMISTIGDKIMSLLIYKPNEGIDELLDLIQSGKVKPIIDKTFPLEKTTEAFRYYGEGRVHGKIVIDLQKTS